MSEQYSVAISANNFFKPSLSLASDNTGNLCYLESIALIEHLESIALIEQLKQHSVLLVLLIPNSIVTGAITHTNNNDKHRATFKAIPYQAIK